MMDSMLFTGLPLCSVGHKHVLVVEFSHNSLILEVQDEATENKVNAKYFIALPENHLLVKTILSNGNRLLVDKSTFRAKFGFDYLDFQTISAK